MAYDPIFSMYIFFNGAQKRGEWEIYVTLSTIKKYILNKQISK